jgi:signal transduction histidine kinase/ActR/RegA family two-component response regulator
MGIGLKKIKGWGKYFFSYDIPLEGRVFNIIMATCVVAGLVGFISTLFMTVSPVMAFVILLLPVVAGIVIWYVNKTNKYKQGAIVIILLFGCVGLPVIFCASGGAESGMPTYLVLGAVLTFMLFKGRICVIMVSAYMAANLITIVLTYRYPEMLNAIDTKAALYADIAIGITVTGIALGLMTKFYGSIYENANRRAEIALKAKDEFLANISHEIRTPMNAVIGLAEIELRKQHKADTAVSFEKIHSSAISLLGIINDVLDISKIESGKFSIVPDTYDIASMINDTVNLNVVRIGSKKINFKLKVDENLPALLYGDELRIKQILNNLLSNAFKYTEEGRVTFTVKSVPMPVKGDAPALAAGGPSASGPAISGDAFVSVGGDAPALASSDASALEKPAPDAPEEKVRLMFEVSDTGRGIPEDDLKGLFTKYGKIDDTEGHKVEGTGLGLFITKSLVELMGGQVLVRSEPGKGSVFTVTLMQGRVGSDAIGKKVAAGLEKFIFESSAMRENSAFEYVKMPYGRVLVVDDIEINLEVASGMMLPYEMNVDKAESGEEAIELVRKGEPRYDLIFMDHMMPGLDGIETVHAIRDEIGENSEYARTVPIIALTANAIVGNEEMFIEHGFQGLLAKPIDVRKLDETLRKWVWRPD